MSTDHSALWDQVKADLRGQMTRATFNSKIDPTRLLHITNENHWDISCPSDSVADTIATRLRQTVERAASSVAGRPVTLAFVVENGQTLQPEPETDANLDLPAELNPALVVARADLLKVYFGRGTIGYDSVPHEIELYKMAALGPAYLLWRSLIAEDTRSLADIAPNFWTPVTRYSLEELARRLNRKHPRVVGGDALECDYSRTRRTKQQQPLRRPEDCCGSSRYSLLWFKLAGQVAGQECVKCLHWSTGLLEILKEAKLARVEMQSGYKPAIQLWRLPTLLTPFQVRQLTPELQTKYEQYIALHGPRYGLAGLDDWLAIPNAYLEPLLPGYDLSQVDNNWRRAIKTKFLANATPNPNFLPCMAENSETE